MTEPRFSKIESRLDLIEYRFNQHLAEEIAGKREILASLDEIKDFQRKQKGFIGGVVLTITAIWAILQFAIPWFRLH
jgi:hypothetical protein